LGDLVLASTVLAPGIFPEPVDWVVSKEFAPLLRGHPRVRKLWEFDRSSGTWAWLQLCGELASQEYDEVYDLHGSLRTFFARIRFLLNVSAGSRWKKVSKMRWRLYGLYLFKNSWPKKWRPRPFVRRFAELAGGSGEEKPDLSFLLMSSHLDEEFKAWAQEVSARGTANYYCVMPGSRWAGKCWATVKYFEVIREVAPRGWVPVILGGRDDPGSSELVQLLSEHGLPHFSGVGRWDLKQVAGVLAGAKAYLGNDTGLAHLAESLGTPALIVFGPTSPEMGFGPWRDKSRALGVQGLGCRPCGKDGRRCYRLSQKYLCMTGLDPAVAVEGLTQIGQL
jgi:ADP-heptose:LPS heptosyltransferase